MKLLIKKYWDDAKIPTRNKSNDTGLDLYCNETVCIPPHSCKLVGTGIAVQPTPDYFTVITSRSSAYKRGLQVNVGIVDTGYRGELKIQVVNITDNPVTVRKGDRVAQLLVIPLVLPQVEIVDSLNETNRGSDGFGSSGR